MAEIDPITWGRGASANPTPASKARQYHHHRKMNIPSHTRLSSSTAHARHRRMNALDKSDGEGGAKRHHPRPQGGTLP